MGVYLATNGVGNYVSTAIIAIIEATTKSGEKFVALYWIDLKQTGYFKDISFK